MWRSIRWWRLGEKKSCDYERNVSELDQKMTERKPQLYRKVKWGGFTVSDFGVLPTNDIHHESTQNFAVLGWSAIFSGDRDRR